MSEGKKESGFQVTDRRFWVEDESTLEKAAIPSTKYPSFVEELKARTELAEQKLREKIQKLEEDNDAFRQRLRGEMKKRLEQDKLNLFRDFLEIIDNFERALLAAQESPSFDGLKEGVELNLLGTQDRGS